MNRDCLVGMGVLVGMVLAAVALPAGAAGGDDGWSEVVLPAARQVDLKARNSGHPYRIFVAEPSSPAPAEGHPVIYVLDGNAAFPVAAFLARGAAARREVTGHVPPLVVGIGYPGKADFDVAARRRDYTPGGTGAGAADGGGEADVFLDFIEGELKPLIEARYVIDRKRQALFGHSFGGLLVTHALLTRPDSFSTFIASSPSIWWREHWVVKGQPSRQGAAGLPRVQISVGALEDDPPKGNYAPDVVALIRSRSMIPEARALAAQLRRLPGGESKVAYHELAGEDHGPAWLPAMSRGMQFFLEQPGSPGLPSQGMMDSSE
ncbi:MAG: alpha/beta hydrolase-fold protein [Zoogloea sp.]|uniref:alpha/beta hydrolase n=1 Tax=Zoogloea sp. TaxID=49181 RepID=UPI0026280361|nr:alpha/beta hydrolase-fold protein [Zoogloea sp.]MDD2987460.1 alpha/beta hydrolase-fold protein [Zoogloea sp.]